MHYTDNDNYGAKAIANDDDNDDNNINIIIKVFM